MKKIILILLFSSVGANAQWVEQVSNSSEQLNDVQFLNEQTIFIAGGYGEILKTINGGLTWNRLSIQPNFYFWTVFFVNENTGYAAGSGPPTYYPVVKTTNGGLNWVPQWVQTYHEWTSLYFFDVNTGIAVGNAGGTNAAAFRTTNGGVNWSFTTFNPYWRLRKVSFINSETGFAVGNPILKTQNRGINWTYIANTPTFFYDFVAFDDLNIIGVGNSGQIFKSSDGGYNWIQLNTGITESLRGISFGNLNTGFAVGNSGMIIKTTDGGSQWFSQNHPAVNYLGAIKMLNSNTGICVGKKFDSLNHGMILKTTNGGVTFIQPISNEIPDKFSLSQNYPNPFNPMTNVKFQMPNEAFVKLIVFDVLGRKISTLVNEQLQPGTYEASWDASNYPSGVYFYRLTVIDASASLSTSFTETKKMLMIK